jgi:LysR family glycine cleavage system transcriptional activator
MKWQVPPLNYLRPFEATARLGSTVRAAEELGRTHGAVSRQIKLLEDWLGQKLFNRDLGRLELTEYGIEYHQAIAHICDVLSHATSSVVRKRNLVRVQGPAAFIGRWLVPRLHSFYQRHPDLEICMSGYSNPAELTSNACDLAISLDAGHWAEMDSVVLMPDLVFPVCDAATANEVAASGSLSTAKLLRSSDPVSDWATWFDTVGLPIRAPAQGTAISDLEIAIRAAVNGHGVALVRGQLVIDELASGALVRPVPHAVRSVKAYWLCRSRFSGSSRAVRVFDQWLRNEAAALTKRLFENLSPVPSDGLRLQHRVDDTTSRSRTADQQQDQEINMARALGTSGVKLFPLLAERSVEAARFSMDP